MTDVVRHLIPIGGDYSRVIVRPYVRDQRLVIFSKQDGTVFFDDAPPSSPIKLDILPNEPLDVADPDNPSD
jgi:hypothetical protein